jgi:2-iminobutanoate/2-iminopropanoate deaminase
MTKKIFFIAVLACTMAIIFSGCQTNDQRIREIVKEELTSTMRRSAITDVNVIGPYSPAQQVGNFLFVSGQIALNQQTGQLENKDIETETRRVLENLMTVLRKAGFDSSDVVSTTVYLKDIADYARMNNIYGGYFTEGNYPARAAIQVAALPREARIEITAIAYKSK